MIHQCLNRRIDSIDVLRAEVAAGQFTTDDARVNLKRLYPTLGVWLRES